MTSAGTPIHERGLRPDVGVAEPSVPFGETPPSTDEAMAKAVEQLKIKKWVGTRHRALASPA